jgi:hypothetical protein
MNPKIHVVRFALLLGVAQLLACGGDSDRPLEAVPPSAPSPSTSDFALQFFGTGSGDIDRVKIPLVTRTASLPVTSLPVNVGAADFTIEFWIKGAPSDNTAALCGTGRQGRDEWLAGNIVLDRDIAGGGDFGEYGVSLRSGRIAFGVGRGNAGITLCGNSNVLDGNWHHVALTRQLQTGGMTIFVDGAQDAQASDVGASLDVSYRADRTALAPNDPFLVIGAEKHDSGTRASFRGLLDELRLSNHLRYAGPFPRPNAPFAADGNTVALYRFNEGSGTTITDVLGSSPGELRVGGANAAPKYVSDTPF